MTFFETFMSKFTLVQELEFFIRIIAASLCGALIGFERTRRFKEAGIRTHIIVGCASALMMLVSKYGFADLQSASGVFFPGTDGADASRIASQVVTGISFLGAGVIFKLGSSVRGLTTAAGIWATCGIGMAIGAGLYVIGVSAAILLLFLQIILHAIPNMSAVERSELHQALSNLEAEILKNEQDSENTGKTIYTITVTTSTEEQDEAITEEITI